MKPNTKHTPGPQISSGEWSYIGDDGGILSHTVRANNGDLVARVKNNADGCLIAAAPDLLAALRDLLSGAPDGLESSKYEAIVTAQRAAARAAIAKAEGK